VNAPPPSASRPAPEERVERIARCGIRTGVERSPEPGAATLTRYPKFEKKDGRSRSSLAATTMLSRRGFGL
jgi:hypothetical protein